MCIATLTQIIQFGTSRLLPAHAYILVDEAPYEGQTAGPITVVQSSGDPARSARRSALAPPSGYPVRIRGLEDGSFLNQFHEESSVTRRRSTATGWVALAKIVFKETEIALSNTGDREFPSQLANKQPEIEQAMSYLAIQLPRRGRFNAHRWPFTMIPLEPVRRNGRVLQTRVFEPVAGTHEASCEWLVNNAMRAYSLVDCIVPEPIEPVGDVAEPFSLWPLKNEDFIPPCRHPTVQMVEDLHAIEALKLIILYLGHTCLVIASQIIHRPPDTVGGLLDQEEDCLPLR